MALELEFQPLGGAMDNNNLSNSVMGNYSLAGSNDLYANLTLGNLSDKLVPEMDPSLYDTIRFQYYAWGITGSIISALGIIGNTLSIIVLSNRRMQSSTSCYLIALAIFDIIVLISLFLFMALPTVYIATGELEAYYNAYPYMHPYAYPTALIAQTCSIYTTVAFTVERYIAVCMPLKAAKMCTSSRARKTILALMVLSIIYNIPRMLEYRTVITTDPLTNMTSARYEYTDLGKNGTFRHIYFIYMHIVVMLAVPCILLAVLNTLLIRAVKRSEKTQGKVNTKTKKENSLTIMLISVIVVFMICQVPSIADNIFMATLSTEVLYTPIFVKITTVSNLMVITNSAINFYLYCVFGKKFRRVFCRIFFICQRSKNRFRETNTSIMQGSCYNGLSQQRNNSKSTLRGNRSNGSVASRPSSRGNKGGHNNNQRSKLSLSVFENGRTRSYYGTQNPYPPVQYAKMEQQTSV